MKKLISSLDHVDPFTKELKVRRNKEFFERVRNTGAYYHHKGWEQDYQKQVFAFPSHIFSYLLKALQIIARRSEVYEASDLY